MKRKYTTILIILALATSIIPFSMFATTVIAAELPDLEPLDIGADFRNKEVPLHLEGFESGLHSRPDLSVD